MKTNWTCASLLKRIHGQYLRDQRNKFLQDVGLIFAYLFISFVILIIFRCPNQLYNTWKGPFPMNLKQFRNHLETNYDLLGYKALFSFRSFFFQPEYLQVALGVDAIDSNSVNSFSVFSESGSQGFPLHRFDRVVESTIDTLNMALYIKFAANGRPYSKLRYPYRFQSFDIETLRCIVKQVGIPTKEFLSWPEKVTYVKRIEEIYKQNASLFNEKVIKKCGILVGYLYEPSNEVTYKVDGHNYYGFVKNVRAFDASWYYIPYLSYSVAGFVILISLYNLAYLSKNVIYFLRLQSELLHHCIKEQLMKLDGISLKDLDKLLLETSSENNHQDSMFIVNDKYLIMLMIDFNENSFEILRKFYSVAPFIIINIDTITVVESLWIVMRHNGYNEYIHFPVNTRGHSFGRAEWLHKRLMALSTGYKHRYVELLFCKL